MSKPGSGAFCYLPLKLTLSTDCVPIFLLPRYHGISRSSRPPVHSYAMNNHRETNFRAVQDGAFSVRLYNPGEIEVEVSMEASVGSGIEVFESNVRNRKGERIANRRTLGPYEIRTMWIERTY